MDDAIIKAYSGQQAGGSLPYFVGSSNQWGGGILSTIARFAFPILKRVLGVAANTAADVIVHKKKLKDSIIDNTMSEVSNFVSGSKPQTTTKRPSTSINMRNDSLSSKKRRKKHG